MYTIYLEYWGNNEIVTQVDSQYKAKKICNKLTNDCGNNFIVWYKKLSQCK